MTAALSCLQVWPASTLQDRRETFRAGSSTLRAGSTFRARRLNFGSWKLNVYSWKLNFRARSLFLQEAERAVLLWCLCQRPSEAGASTCFWKKRACGGGVPVWLVLAVSLTFTCAISVNSLASDLFLVVAAMGTEGQWTSSRMVLWRGGFRLGLWSWTGLGSSPRPTSAPLSQARFLACRGLDSLM